LDKGARADPVTGHETRPIISFRASETWSDRIAIDLLSFA
jgi:hypothetical protein